MSRLAQTFANLRVKNEKAFVAFVTAGDPWPDRTADVIVALADAGADIIELGIPFSDPLADGPTIQASTQRALDEGMTPPKVLHIVHQVRAAGCDVPLVLMGAYNPVLQYGAERFARAMQDAGADAVILTDLSPEEAGGWKAAADPHEIDTIFLLAPTSTPARMALVARMASGFVYCVSRTGVTGARSEVPADLPPLLEAIRARVGDLPVCVGFGISRPEHVRTISQFADGAVVGASIVERLHNERDNTEMLRIVGDYVREMKAATR